MNPATLRPSMSVRSIRHSFYWRLKALFRTGGRGIFGDSQRQHIVVLFHIGRSGSTLLGDMLGQHPKFYWDGEIFRDLFLSMTSHCYTASERFSHIDAAAYLGKRSSWLPLPYYGFEMKFFHLRLLGMDLEKCVSILEGAGVHRYIILERQNTLRAVISSLVATHTGRWHLPAGKRTMPAPVSVPVDNICLDWTAKPLVAFLEDYRRQYREVGRLLKGRQSLRLVYEKDLMTDPVVGYQKACRFLGEDPAPARVRYQKTNPFALHRMVLNMGEVKKVLAGTEFEWMTHEKG
jgi:hypothetical protein